MKREELARYIDHTLLKPTARPEDFIREAQIAIKNGCAALCVPPSALTCVKDILKGSDTLLCTVIGFPLGYATREAKEAETKDALAKGAKEIDMVVNISKLLSGDTTYVGAEIASLATISHDAGAVLKVIIETAYLSTEQKKVISRLCVTSGADFVKTSTGFAPSGATPEDIALIRAEVGPIMKIKASGGVRDYAGAIKMIEAGADRIGCSSTEALLDAAQ